MYSNVFYLIKLQGEKETKEKVERVLNIAQNFKDHCTIYLKQNKGNVKIHND